jgi:hypothetical protein
MPLHSEQSASELGIVDIVGHVVSFKRKRMNLFYLVQARQTGEPRKPRWRVWRAGTAEDLNKIRYNLGLLFKLCSLRKSGDAGYQVPQGKVGIWSELFVAIVAMDY